MGKGQELYRKAKNIIPGGTQLLSKRPELHLPDIWPAYYKSAKGSELWDLDGARYTDMSYMGIGACILGYADPDVDAAVRSVIDGCSMTTLNSPEEVELAELLCRLHPWAEMVRFARTGGESMAVAVRIARAKTSKDIVLFCGYHGWHDWYLSANLADDKALDGHLLEGLKPGGVPRKLRGTSFPFKYNDKKGFEDLMDTHKGDIAAVVMEPLRNYYPEDGFLEFIREMTRKQRVVLIFDEITSGWRINAGGAHLDFKVDPDIAVFAKGMSNGYPMAAIIGRRDVMEAAQDTFISSTYWTERIGPAAALATIKKIEKEGVPERLMKTGAKVREGWQEAADKAGIKIEVQGIDPLVHFSFKHDDPMVLKTLFTQIMLEKGFLATTALYASHAHDERSLDRYLKAVEDTFRDISNAIAAGKQKDLLKGPVCHEGFKRLN